MKLLRYAIFCILVLILSILIRRPADMPTKEIDIIGKGTAMVEKVKRFFPIGHEKEKVVPTEPGKKEEGKSDHRVAPKNEDDEEDEVDDEDEDPDEDDEEE
jgi:hypothetical protein